MATEWKLEGVLERAIVTLEGQMPGDELGEYGAPEHMAVLRYGTNEILATTMANLMVQKDKEGKPVLKDGKPVQVALEPARLVAEFNIALKEWFSKESAFLSISSNAKKKLAELDGGKAYPKLAGVEKKTRGYD